MPLRAPVRATVLPVAPAVVVSHRQLLGRRAAEAATGGVDVEIHRATAPRHLPLGTREPPTPG